MIGFGKRAALAVLLFSVLALGAGCAKADPFGYRNGNFTLTGEYEYGGVSGRAEISLQSGDGGRTFSVTLLPPDGTPGVTFTVGKDGAAAGYGGMREPLPAPPPLVGALESLFSVPEDAAVTVARERAAAEKDGTVWTVVLRNGLPVSAVMTGKETVRFRADAEARP